MKRKILFIGYDPLLHDEIWEFLSDHNREAYFSETAIETIRVLDSNIFESVVLNMKRLDDAIILRYINMNYHDIRVLIMPGNQFQDAIPALVSGKYEILQEPFRLAELKNILGNELK